MEEYVLRDALHDFTSLVVELYDGAYEELMRDGRVYLETLASAGLQTYAFVAALILIARAAKDLKLKITESLEIDCATAKSSGAAIYLLKQVLLAAVDEDDTLACIERLTYALS